MVIARFWAATGITSAASKLGTSTPAIRFMNGCLVVRMRENCLHEIVEHLGIGRHRPARVGVHVPGAQLVQRRGLLVGEVQDVAPCGAAPPPPPPPPPTAPPAPPDTPPPGAPPPAAAPFVPAG